MDNMIQTLSTYLSFPFVRYALIVGVLIALCASMLGTTLVLKKLSYIGDGLAHIAFGSVSIAAALRIANQELLVFPITAIASIVLLKMSNHKKINGDAAIAMMSVGSLAIGYLLMNTFSVASNVVGDVHTTLFGATSILTLTIMDVVTCIVLSILVLIVFVVYYHKLFAVTFDENFAKASGIHVAFYNIVIAIMISAVVVIAMELVGSLLVSALIVFPPLTAMRLFTNYKSVVISSALFSVVGAFSGIIISILAATPVGSTIVVMDILIFLVVYLISIVLKKR